MAQDFQLDLVEGELLIRDTPEPLALTNPTSLSGSVDTGEGGTGAVTDGSFDTPAVSFATTALGFNVYVKATFTDAAPGTGTIDADGNVTFNASVNVNLDVTVGDTNPPALTGDCNAGPVSLTLESTAPWDPETNEVTVADPNFSIPEFPTVPASPTNPGCIDIISSNINTRLADTATVVGGHSLEMTIEGPLELPTPAQCKTLTTFTMDPAGEVKVDDPVDFTAAVVQDPATAAEPACADVASGQIPTGLVEFRAGNILLGTGVLDGTGTATFTTDDIPAGTFPMTARYRGEAPFGKSTSASQTLKVAARPLITADFPTSIVIGADPVEIDVTLTNNTLGSTLTNARLDMSIKTVDPEGGAITFLAPLQLDLAYWDGAAWVPVVATGVDPNIASVSPTTGFPLPAGSEVARKFRIGTSDVGLPPTPKHLEITLEVVEVDPNTGLPAVAVAPDAVGSMTAEVLLANDARSPLTFNASLRPHTLRQGQTARVDFNLLGVFDVATPGGIITVLLDGKPVQVRENQSPPELGLQPSVTPRANNVEFPIPDDALTGERTVTLKYSGNSFYEPAEWTGTLHVFASRGATYVCQAALLSTDRIYVNLAARADMGAARPSGGTLDLALLDVGLYLDRGDASGLGLFLSSFGSQPEQPVSPPGTVNGFTPQTIGFNFDGTGTGSSTVTGTGTATHTTVANSFPMTDATRPVDPGPDQVWGFKGESAALTVNGAPGDIIPIKLNTVKVTGSYWSGFGDPFPFNLECKPVADPVTLGQVTVAGTTLTVDAPDPTRLGDEVTLDAKVAPAGATGTVGFRDGTSALTVTSVRSDGTATFTTDTLTAGTHDLTATFYGGLASLTTTSDTVTLTVLPETDCAAFAEDGNGAVVRLVYIELLGRCPDQVGYDHWVGRLDGGTSPDAFARTISRTSEAVGQVVDDAYDTMLGRAPDAGGRTFWIGRLQGHGRYDQLLADLAGSGEFWALAGSTNTGFVTRVYEQLLDRAPDPGGLEYWVGRLDGGASRQVLVRSLANKDEPLGRLVLAAYEEILGRAPGSSERTNGIEYLRETGNRSGLYAELIGRPEFEDRAQDFPNPED